MELAVPAAVRLAAATSGQGAVPTRLAAVARDAARAMGFRALLEQRRSRLTLAITSLRCLNGMAIGLLVSASINMLYELVREAEEAAQRAKEMLAAADRGKDDSPSQPALARQTTPAPVHHRVQRITTLIGTVSTLVDFFTGPLIGRFIDAVGRLPTMTVALSISGLARLSLALRPSLGAYFAYRVLTTITGPAFMGATLAAVSDLHGPGTQSSAAASSMVQRYALLSMLLGTYLGRIVKSSRLAFVLCGSLQLTAVGVAGLALQETLPVRSKMDWSLRGLSPTAALAVYGRSRALAALGALATLRELAGYVNIHAVYRRQRFAEYGREQESTQMILMQVCGFLSTFLRVPLMDGLGLRASTRLHAWCDVAVNMISALAPRAELLYLNPVVSLLQCGGLSVERCLQQEAALVGVGQGELGAAEAKRCFLPSLIMPNVFTAIHTRLSSTAPAAPYFVAAALAALAAEVATPWAFRRLSPTVGAAARPKGW